jgi:MFS family permease
VQARRPRRILPVIVVTQFAGTSLWFASNGILPDLERSWGLGANATGYTTSAVQLGFIAGTLAFAFFALSDRFSPRPVFFTCALAGSIANLCIYLFAGGLVSLMVLRFVTGVFLAGIYPVGMKIAASWFERGLGEALGYLVGAVVMGTAFPHLLRAFSVSPSWSAVIVAISMVSAAGGIAMLLLVPDGPNLTSGARFDPTALATIFREPNLRASACAYWGHMWELYAVWAFVPVVLATYTAKTGVVLDVSLWSFVIIGAGGAGCALGGILSNRLGSARVAAWALGASCLCCLFSPLAFALPPALFIAGLVFWGIAVVADSPQYSALTAQTAPAHLVGSALTVVVSVGFLITIPSIQLVNWLLQVIPPSYVFLPLVPGPVLGMIALARFRGTALGTGRPHPS